MQNLKKWLCHRGTMNSEKSKEKRHIAMRGIQWRRHQKSNQARERSMERDRARTPRPKHGTHPTTERSHSGTGTSLVGAASSGVNSCGLEGASKLSGLPLPHESSRMLSAKLGRAWEGSVFFVVRELEGDDGPSWGTWARWPPCMGLAAESIMEGVEGPGESMKPRHLRQPSKSIRACMQPHSVTFCSSQGKPTG
jgi:hypothetical protein